MEKKSGLKSKKSRGITLIALVITIIVLLILAGISIATLTGENGVLTKASVAKEETKKAEYKEALELIGVELRPEQVMEQLSSKEYMDRQEEKIQEEIDKQGLWEGATKERKNDLTIWVTTKEGWIYQVTEKEVKYLGTREENPEPPTLQEAGIEFNYDPNDWTKNDVKVTITTKVEGFILQYTIEDPKNENAWKNYDASTGIPMTENGDIHARLKNNLGEIGEYATGNVSKIDRIDPSIQVTQGAITSKSIVVNVTASDEQSGLASSNAYQYYLNGTLVPAATGSSYTFAGLNPSTKYTIRVIVYDKAGNDAEQTITPTTGTPTIAEVKGGSPFGTTTQIKDNSGNKVSIPGGFRVTTDSGNNVSEGVVIEDANENQFVWIPVRTEADFMAETSYPKSGDMVEFWDEVSSYPDGIYNISRLIEIGGFYVSRYWIGSVNGTLVSKSGVNINNYSASRDSWVSVLKGSFINTNFAKSCLISGVGYDAMMKFVNNSFDRGNNKVFVVTNTYSAGSYVTGEAQSGIVCNIYDLIPPYFCVTSELCSTTWLGTQVVARGYSGVPSMRYYWGSNYHLPVACARAALFVF